MVTIPAISAISAWILILIGGAKDYVINIHESLPKDKSSAFD